MSTNKGSMKTPPSSPMMESSPDDGPPSLVESTSLSASPGNAPKPTSTTAASSSAATKMDASPPPAASPARRHSRTATPSTPIQMEDVYAAPAAGQGAPQLFSTPGRSGASGGAMPAPRPSGGFHLTSDLTPVISNSAGTYVDAHLGARGNRPGMPGLTALGEGCAVITPGGARIGGDADPPRGLQRRSQQRPFPLPRAGLPPARRSEGAAAAASIMRLPSTASSDSSQLRISPSTPSNDTPQSGEGGGEENDGLAGLLGEGLAMPRYELEDSSVDTSGGSGQGKAAKPSSSGAGASIFQAKDAPGLAPIELRPDRKFFSFQGASQYRQSVDDEGAPERMETIPSAVPAGDAPQKNQYQPLLRGQHGVQAMADAEDLDAIFKAPRQQPPRAALPAETEGASMMVDGQQQLPMREELGVADAPAEGQHPSIDRPYPVDDRQFSIPSIRLANHVNSLSRSGYPLDNTYSYQSEYTYEDDVSLEESYYSFLGDDDDASLSSRGSVDVSTRKRRISLHLQRAASAEVAQGVARAESQIPTTIHSKEGAGGSAVVSPPPAIAPSNSFIEKVQGISIDGAFKAAATKPESTSVEAPPLPQRANTFDSEPPPLLSVDAAQPFHADDDDIDYSRRKRRQRHGRRKRKEGAAAQWLADLQSQSLAGGGGGSDVLIVEAASSKFLTGDAEGVGSGGRAGIEALGMPHPLCRTNTIEAGPFVRRSGEVALTSSGSGD